MFLVNKRQFSASSGKKCYLFLSIENRRIFYVLENMCFKCTEQPWMKTNSSRALWTEATMSASSSSSHFSTWPRALAVEITSCSWTTSPSLLFICVISSRSVNSSVAIPSKHFFRCGCTLTGQHNNTHLAASSPGKLEKKLSPQGKSFLIFSLNFVNCYQNQ